MNSGKPPEASLPRHSQSFSSRPTVQEACLWLTATGILKVPSILRQEFVQIQDGVRNDNPRRVVRVGHAPRSFCSG